MIWAIGFSQTPYQAGRIQNGIGIRDPSLPTSECEDPVPGSITGKDKAGLGAKRARLVHKAPGQDGPPKFKSLVHVYMIS